MYSDSKVQRVKEAYQAKVCETACEPRAASPIDMELGELRIQIDRLERLHHILADRLQPVTVPYPVDPANEKNPYPGCVIGSQINDAGLRVHSLCNSLDRLLSSLQV